MFASSGDSGPPCGVPSTLLTTTPSTMAPARRYRPLSFNTRLSRIACAIFPFGVPLCGPHGICCLPSRPEPIAVFAEARLPDRCHGLPQHLLDEPIQYRGNA